MRKIQNQRLLAVFHLESSMNNNHTLSGLAGEDDSISYELSVGSNRGGTRDNINNLGLVLDNFMASSDKETVNRVMASLNKSRRKIIRIELPREKTGPA
jgi:hypothetical protein